MPKKKYYTARDVDHLIPQLETIFEHIDSCRARAAELTTQAMAGAETVEAALEPMMRARVQFLLSAVEEDIQHIHRLGGFAKDIDQGLVDFPGQIEGEEVWLCWKRGENKVQYWHSLDQGFGQRQTLRRSEVSNTTFH